MINDTVLSIPRYEILERVGRGGMGVLYRGRDTVLDREVAIKVMNGDFDGDETAHARFFREAKAAARLQHRNVVTIFEFAEHDGTPYIVMEFLRGRSLAAKLKDGAPLSLPESLDVVIQLCTGLDFAHRQGVVHRDVKPGNIWLCDDGAVKLLDFGIAKSASSTMTKAGDVMGSPSYMSPEQIAGRELDGRSDVFSAGVVLYELLSGHRPFDAESPTAVMMKIVQEPPVPLHERAPGLSPALGAAVDRALQKELSQRYACAADFAADLQAVRATIQDADDPSLLLGETLFADDFVAPHPSLRALTDPTLRAVGTAPAPASPRRFRGVVSIAVVAIVALVAGVAMWSRRAAPVAAPVAQDVSTPGVVSELPPAPIANPPVPPVETPATLKISSDPTGAEIVLDGRDTGQTTPSALAFKPGKRPRRVRLTKRGFEAREASLTDAVLREGSLALRLDPVSTAPVSLDLSGPYAFEVLEGNRVLSAASASHRLTVTGRRSLRLRAAEYFFDRSFAVDPASGRQARFEAPPLGRLTIRSSLETCTVLVDGRAVGFPPIANLPIAAGAHALQLKCQSGPGRQTSVTVTGGQETLEIIR